MAGLMRQSTLARAERFMYKPAGYKPKASTKLPTDASDKAAPSPRASARSARSKSPRRTPRSVPPPSSSSTAAADGSSSSTVAPAPSTPAAASEAPTPPLSARRVKSEKTRKNAKRRGKAKGEPSAFDSLESVREGEPQDVSDAAPAAAVGTSTPDTVALEALVARLEAEVERLQLENNRLTITSPPAALTSADAPSANGNGSSSSGAPPAPAPMVKSTSKAGPATFLRAISFSSSASEAATAAEDRVRTLTTANEGLTSQVEALTQEVAGLTAECTALRSLAMTGGGSEAGSSSSDAAAAENLRVAKAEAAQARAEAAQARVEAQEAQAEVRRLGTENERLLALLDERSGGGGGAGGGASGGGGGGGGGGATLTLGPPPLQNLRRQSTQRAPDPARERALFAAVGFNVDTKGYARADIGKLRELLEEGVVNLNARDGKGSPPLSHAAWNGEEEAMLLLMAYGADLDAANLDDSTPLHFCVFNRQARAAALLIAAGADFAAAEDDAGAVGSPEVRAIFQGAAALGRQHPMLKAAAEKVDAMRASHPA